VQREELRATDVPVVAAEVSIVYLEVSEELLKTLDEGATWLASRPVIESTFIVLSY